jgi:hypothetical protein
MVMRLTVHAATTMVSRVKTSPSAKATNTLVGSNANWMGKPMRVSVGLTT